MREEMKLELMMESNMSRNELYLSIFQATMFSDSHGQNYTENHTNSKAWWRLAGGVSKQAHKAETVVWGV